ncbi:unnamed protein product, partial [Polarella glacialis]
MAAEKRRPVLVFLCCVLLETDRIGYASKCIRNGIRLGDLLHFETFEEKLRELIKWSQKRYGAPQESDQPSQQLMRECLRNYDTRRAFDPENQAK